MTSRIEFVPGVLDDLERIIDHLLEHDPEHSATRVQQIVRAVDVLGDNPMIGRPREADMRELVIGRDSHGYVSLYRYAGEIDTVFVLAIRSQKESGYAR